MLLWALFWRENEEEREKKKKKKKEWLEIQCHGKILHFSHILTSNVINAFLFLLSAWEMYCHFIQFNQHWKETIYIKRRPPRRLGGGPSQSYYSFVFFSNSFYFFLLNFDFQLFRLVSVSFQIFLLQFNYCLKMFSLNHVSFSFSVL